MINTQYSQEELTLSNKVLSKLLEHTEKKIENRKKIGKKTFLGEQNAWALKVALDVNNMMMGTDHTNIDL